jgi:arylsulfatase A-like enzyme
VRNTTVVLPPKSPEERYHLSEDLADDAIHWLNTHKALQADKPFYMYWASGAIHGPHHIMKEWADKYKGKFDDGWDAYRERVFSRAKEKGWIPDNAQLTPRHETITASLSYAIGTFEGQVIDSPEQQPRSTWPPKTELSSRPERSVVEGPAVFSARTHTR